MPRFATLETTEKMSAVLKVVGVGGGGCNAIESMMKRGLTDVDYIAVNTDAQVLAKMDTPHRVQIGKNLTKGLGAGADPNVGKKAAEEDRELLAKILEGSDMVFITAGMGGGTGTGAAPLIASVAQSLGALVIGIVTKPFRWEGKKRMMNAEKGIQELRQYVDSLIIIPNERLLNILDKSIAAATAFDKPNEVLYEATRGIADIITIPGIINVDFADVRSVMNESGEALMGCGTASGENRAVEAAQKAISSPLLEGVSIKGAKNILLNVTGSNNLTMQEIDEGNKVIYDAAGEEANVIFGWVNKEEMNEYVSYTVIATGFDTAQASSTLRNFAERKEEKPKESFFSGYGLTNKTVSEEEMNNLEIPTIFRVKSTNSSFANKDFVPQSGYKIDKTQTSLFERNDAIEEEEKQDEDSSSFLRMMMD